VALLFACASFGRYRPDVPVRLAAPWTPTPRAQRAGGALTSTFRPLTPRRRPAGTTLTVSKRGVARDLPLLAKRPARLTFETRIRGAVSGEGGSTPLTRGVCHRIEIPHRNPWGGPQRRVEVRILLHARGTFSPALYPGTCVEPGRSFSSG